MPQRREQYFIYTFNETRASGPQKRTWGGSRCFGALICSLLAFRQILPPLSLPVPEGFAFDDVSKRLAESD
ncbi:hypothetical protein BDV37DRAFT_242162 [Aspergillus pseudonomiae]|uniref:Uncharacterized protein n=1 Tax=Aspergillus pseudonomiae TaxID=1506151 RepID=A0A5N7DKK5_9EURO|nr:uncharacterized protein BDV37DRAFT_242162 [Aspergillus pseudonomiae]KAE8406894.1 hypothetical protein BDV37DRAFT_242162 [Aspergillus pseudonomiae]